MQSQNYTLHSPFLRKLPEDVLHQKQRVNQKDDPDPENLTVEIGIKSQDGIGLRYKRYIREQETKILALQLVLEMEQQFSKWGLQVPEGP